MKPRVFVSVWSDLAAAPDAQRYWDLVGDYTSCDYGEALDGAEDCVLVVHYNHPALPYLALTNVLQVHNELGQVHEYRISRLEDSRTSPLVTVRAAPVLHDLNRIRVQQLSGGVWTDAFTASLSPRGWAQLVCDEMARRGMPWWRVGTIQLDGTLALQCDGTTGLGVLRRVTDGTLVDVFARRADDAQWEIDLMLPQPVQRPLVIVGQNVEALDRELNIWDGQLSIAAPRGASTGGEDSPPTSVEETPWVLEEEVSPGVLRLADREASDAPLAIEPDQFVGVEDIGYADKAVAGLVPSPMTVVADAYSGDGSAGYNRLEAVARIGDRLWVTVGSPAPGPVPAKLYVYRLTDSVREAVYELTAPHPRAAVYVPGVNKLYVVTEDLVEVVDPADGSVLDTIAVTGASWALLAGDYVWVVATAGMVLIDPTTDTIASTIANGTTTFPLLTEDTEELETEDGEPLILEDAPELAVGACRAVTDGEYVYATGTAGDDLAVLRYRVDLAQLDGYRALEDEVPDPDAGYTQLALDTVHHRLWVGATTTGDCAVLGLVAWALAGVVEGEAALRALGSYGGHVVAGEANNRLRVFDGGTLGLLKLVQEETTETWSPVRMIQLLGDGWFAYGGSDASRTTSFVRFISQTSWTGEHRRRITAVDYETSQVTVDSTELLPWRLREPVWLINADGTRFRELWSPVAVELYGHREEQIPVPDRRGERNLVRAPVPQEFDADEQPEYWGFSPTTERAIERRWRDPDNHPTVHTRPVVLTMPTRSSEHFTNVTIHSGLYAGMVLQPGDVFVTRGVPLTVVERKLVPGDTGYTTLFQDVITEDVDPPGLITDHVPTAPGSTGVTGYQGHGSGAQFYQVWPYGVFYPSALGDPAPPVRINTDYADDLLVLWADYDARLNGGYGVGAVGLAWNMATSGSQHYRLEVRFSTEVAFRHQVVLIHVNAGEGINTTVLGSFSGGSLQRLRVAVQYPTVRVYRSVYGSGLNEELVLEHTLSTDYRGTGRNRLGFRVGTGLTGIGIQVPVLVRWGWGNLDPAPPPYPGSPVTVWCQSPTTNAFPMEPATYRRPLPARLLDRTEHPVMPVSNGMATPTGLVLELPVYIPPAMRPGQKLWLGFYCWAFAGSFVHLIAKLEEYQTFTSPALVDLVDPATSMQQTDFDNAKWQAGELLEVDLRWELRTATWRPGWHRLRLTYQLGGYAGGGLFDPRVAVYWAGESVPAFRWSNGASWQWGAAQYALIERSAPLIHYRVKSLESDTESYALGARVRLRDPEQGVSTDRPRIVSVRRVLPPDGSGDSPSPEMELDARGLDLVRQLVAKGSV